MILNITETIFIVHGIWNLPRGCPLGLVFFNNFIGYRLVRFKGRFPVMVDITRILAVNICRQFSFVISTIASTLCLVENSQLVCYSQPVNATSQYNDSGSLRCSKWPNIRMVAVMKHCWLIVQERRSCRER